MKGFFAVLVSLLTFHALAITPGDLRCEYLRNPLGIDVDRPRLSWILQTEEPGQKQTAYEVLVASSEKTLGSNRGDLWSSGKVSSDHSIFVRYSGQPLSSHQQCFWKVRIWDVNGKASAWSKPSRWTMGLLNESDWHGQWIGKDEGEKKTSVAGTSWIWYPEPNANPAEKGPIGVRYFRKTFDIPAGDKITSAELLVTGDNQFEAYVNGMKLGTGSNFKTLSGFDVAQRLKSGRNVVAVSVSNSGDAPNPAGALAILKVTFVTRPALSIVADETWKAATEPARDWQHVEFDDSKWKPARKLGPVGMGPWGEISAPESRRLAARYLRKEFSLGKGIRRATAYISGLGLSELYLNGKKVGDAVLSPGLTEYDKRVYYVTYDVTSQVERGKNAMGVILGNGRFYAPRTTVPTATRTYGFPKLLLQLRVEYGDGTVDEIVSDGTWKLTDNGPIRGNNEYDGEDYDARLELKKWAEVAFDDSNWQPVQSVKSPGGKLAAQMAEPIRVTEALAPVSMTEVAPGVYIFDLGQNIAGWCRLRVAGPRGTQVTLRHAEILKPDGTLYVDNLRSAKCTDTYVLRGLGTEVYEPRFTYHGFRYVEVTGFPGRPTLSSIEGRVVHDDLESTGIFACSNPLLNQITKNVRWGLRDNYRSVPTDCCQRDERQGWVGDRDFESKGETYMFDTSGIYAHWLQAMTDAQKDNGSLSDVNPSYWPLYNDNVAWPSAAIVMPGMLHQQFGDEGIVTRQYGSMKKWMDYMSGFIQDGIISKDSYGDWCVPPEEQTLIHSKDPKRQTSKPLLATAYFYNNCKVMSRYAKLMGQLGDAQRYSALAEKLKAAFNAKFLNKELGQYDNGTQTSSVLPLAFGLVPEDQRERVFAHLVKTFEATDGHIATGLVGGQWLNRVLTDNGRPDISYTMATKTNYPSWGYMVQKGATTIWELWNGDTADPAMNSGNHLMLVGDLVIWLYEDIAGIKSDPDRPGFKHIIMRPQPTGDLKWARATHRSPYGLISSEWKKAGESFSWDVMVPANTTATIYVPAKAAESVLESGKPVARSRGLTFVKMEKGAAVFEAASGRYHFATQ